MAPSRHDWKIVDWDVKPHFGGINLELSQFLNLRVEFLLKYTMFDHLHLWSIFFFGMDMFESIQISILKYQFSI